ncbi:MAG: MBOAT family protein [Planctomycetota bacterium]|nr:MAG: MBOAT family protein [Planctomycetota bacterium]
MAFNSWQYVLFLPLVVGLHFALPARQRWLLLLLASYVFYACWEPAYLILIVASTLVDYACGLGMGAAPGDARRSPARRRALLCISLLCNLGLLFTFKYWDFFATAVHEALGWAGVGWDSPTLDVLLPVGISFYTFQTLSYTIEVYRGNQRPERHLGIFALYVSYFPQLVAGPIERSVNLLPQLRAETRWCSDRAADGLRLIVCGLVKKVVIADRLALLVDGVYADPSRFDGPMLALATVFFAFQIYCDFSGYSDIAIGSAEILGHRLMKNFERPYFARSVPEFWGRWHISLSTWFRDYLYIPLGGSRVAPWLRWRNILIVFAVSGLWHGASWCFVIWGALHGMYYLLGEWLAPVRAALARATGLVRRPTALAVLSCITTFVLVDLAWIFFRADTAADAFTVLRRLGAGWSEALSGPTWSSAIEAAGTSRADVRLGAALVLALLAAQLLRGRLRSSAWLGGLPTARRWAALAALVLLLLNQGVVQRVPFLYFQF